MTAGRCPCVLDCPYCHWHVVDVYSHLAFDPCAAAIYVRDKAEETAPGWSGTASPAQAGRPAPATQGGEA